MSYTPHTWVTGETITADKLNNMEGGIANNDAAIIKPPFIVAFCIIS